VNVVRANARVAANTVVKNLFSMPEYQRAQRISIYLSMPTGEISTADIVHDALKQGKQVFVPFIYKVKEPPRSMMDMLQLHSLGDYHSLALDRWGIPTLSQDSVHERENSFGVKGLSSGSIGGKGGLDMIVMPGMAFDEKLGRLGHGKGYYDFFLARCLEHSKSAGGVSMPFLGEFFPFSLCSNFLVK
jgi:5-formyltetrahydrofolate cyclo-ligase